MQEKTETRKVLKNPYTGVQVRIGVMGSAGGELTETVSEKCKNMGRIISEKGCCLLTGACPGLPDIVVQGAKSANGHVIGISPASNLKEHIETFDSPYKDYDVMIFTGLGLMGRELINIRSSDIIIIVGGRTGTLGEFAIAYEEGKLIGVLTGTGGVADTIKMTEDSFRKDTGSEIIYDDDPQSLIDRLTEKYTNGDYKCPCYPEKLLNDKENVDDCCCK